MEYVDLQEKKDHAYEVGAVDAYRLRYGRYKKSVDPKFYADYDRGYEEQPYGMKEYE